MAPLVGPRIADLVRSIDPNYGIEPDAEEQVLQLADDFLDKVTKQAIRLAQHRGSKTLEVRDLQIVLAKNFGIVVPGLGMPPARTINRSSVTSKTSTTASGSNSKSSSSSSTTPGSATKRNSSTSIGGETTNSARKKANIGSQEGAVSGGASASII
jgi:histone H3/H4